MNILTQALPHYSDFDSTSECESITSLVLPYNPRPVNRKVNRSSDGQIRRKTGARAIRRENNECFLRSMVTIVSDAVGCEFDDSMLDHCTEDTGFKRLFENDQDRDVWETFISLPERQQIALLSGFAFTPTSVNDNAGGDVDDFVGGYNNSNRRGRHQRHGKKAKARRRPVHVLDPIDEEVVENTLDTIEALSTMVGDDISPHDEASPFPLTVPTRSVTIGKDDDLCVDDGSSAPVPGTLSEKLLDFLRSSIAFETSNQSNARPVRGKKHRRFSLQDLCLIQRVDAELRRAFGFPRSRVRVWTPSTSLLQTSTDEHAAKQWVRGHPLALSGFQRMLVHSVATYFGLRSFSNGSDALPERQVFVEKIGDSFNPPDRPFVAVIHSTMLAMMGQSDPGQAATSTEAKEGK